MTDITPDEIHYCAVHTDRETELRCNKCDRYMCAQCAVNTPVGYRCRECVRQVEDKFFSANNNDMLLNFAVSAGISAIGGLIVAFGNVFILSFFLGIIWAGIVSEASLRVTSRRRGRYTGEFCIAGVIIGGFLGGAIQSYFAYNDRFGAIIRMAEEANVNIDEMAAELMIPAELYMPLGNFILSNTFSLGLLVFVGVTAAAVYARMKS
jgi:hypothetical protein